MNLDHYKNFVSIIDAGTISAASRELMIAQPALSNQIKSLEDDYGVQLVIRHPRRLELTDAGKILYDKIKSICYLEDSARKEINACVSGNRGTLWLGCTPANPDPLLYRLLLDYHAAFPQISFEIFERNSDELVELLQSGIIEIGLLRTQPQLLAPSIRPVLSHQDRMMAYFHREHRVLRPEQEEIPLGLLRPLPISISHGLRRAFTAACEREGFSPQFLNISASRSTSQLWAADRITAAIVVSARPFDDGDYCCRPIHAEGLLSQRLFAVSRERPLSSVGSAFLQFCRQHPMMEEWMEEGAEA